MNMHVFIRVLATGLLTFSLAACGQGPAAEKEAGTSPSETQSSQQPTPPALNDPTQQTAVGQLQDVNLTARTVTVKDTAGQEETFLFTESTEIVGTPSAQGLSNQHGNNVTVTYADQEGRKTAVRIEVAPK